MRRYIQRSAKRTLSTSSQGKNVVLVDGCRIPFTLGGTTYKDYLAVDLQRFAFKGLVDKTALPTNELDYLLSGTVIQECRTSNIAREASLGAGLPVDLPSSTVTLACISSNLAVTTATEKILAGQADCIMVGGTETFSDVPIRFSKPIRKRLLGLAKAMKKGPMGALGLAKGLKLKDLAPEAPAIANYTTGEVMGKSSDRLSAKFGVSRKEMDEYSVRSHIRAAKAHADGIYADEIVPVDGSVEENGIKGDSTYEKISKLKPAFIKSVEGTHTAANSSFLTDGASAALIMSEEKALALGYRPKAYIRGWSYVACDPFEELLLGPTYATAQLLKKHNLALKDIGVLEIHEAFAGQVLSNFNAMASEKFAHEKLSGFKVGEWDQSRSNLHGGSLSLGHPFGATGARLCTTAANRLQREEKQFALLTACADGGLATACLLERYP